MAEKKLNLGCGAYKKAGYINVDKVDIFRPDLLLDLNDMGAYRQFGDNEYDEINISHNLEHLDRPFEAMKEFHRILKQGGRLIIEVPHFSRGFTHAEHEKGFDVTFPFYFDKRFAPGYYGFAFDLQEMRLTWMIRFDIKQQVMGNMIVLSVAKFLNAVISFLANLSPYFCSRIWCFWVGGFEEIRYVFIKPIVSSHDAGDQKN